MTFASRRTNIPPAGDDDDGIVRNILTRDGYTRVEGLAKVGDVAVYKNDDGKIEHTGIVCRTETVGAQPVVWIWSTWGGLGEFEHKSGVSPYNGEPEYWRLNL